MRVMEKAILYLLVLLPALIVDGQPVVHSLMAAELEVPSSTPYYFIAIHNEPTPPSSDAIAANFLLLTAMIARADSYNMKITLMFTAQWANYIVADYDRFSTVQGWAANGHEIGSHHHSIYHLAWDGYSNYNRELALQVRYDLYQKNELFLGSLDDAYMGALHLINPGMKAGCVNDEMDKHAMPDAIIYDTCSGFANIGEPGQTLSDATDPVKGRNDYISAGYYKDIKRLWLTHFQTTTMERQLEAQTVFLAMDSGVYGSVNHSSSGEQDRMPFLPISIFFTSRIQQGKRAARSPP